MMRACHVRIMIACVMRGVTWHAGGAARCDVHEDGLLRTRGGGGCALVTHVTRDHET